MREGDRLRRGGIMEEMNYLRNIYFIPNTVYTMVPQIFLLSPYDDPPLLDKKINAQRS